MYTIYGASTKRTTDENGNVWIEPGSRPIYITDNDQTVSCFENEFQSRCDGSTDKVLYSCTNFLNGTDYHFLWYQELQNQSIFVPTGWTYRRANNNGECRMNMVNFYIEESNRDSVKYIDTSRGVLMTNFENSGIINVCYISPESNLRHVRYHLDTFVQCLALYSNDIHI